MKSLKLLIIAASAVAALAVGLGPQRGSPEPQRELAQADAF